MLGISFANKPSKNSSLDALHRLPLGHPKASSLKGLVQPRLIRPANQPMRTAIFPQRNAAFAAKAPQPSVELLQACGLYLQRASRTL